MNSDLQVCYTPTPLAELVDFDKVCYTPTTLAEFDKLCYTPIPVPH